MLVVTSSDNPTSPSLETGDNNHGEKKTRWWQKVLDVEEVKNQVLFSIPIILTNVFYYAISMGSVMFAGHLGKLELAGATLANSWPCVTGFAFMSYGSRKSRSSQECHGCVLKPSVFLALIVVVSLAFASLTPFLAMSITFDSVQGVLSGPVDRLNQWPLLPSRHLLANYIAQKVD